MREWTADQDATILSMGVAKATRALGFSFSSVRNRKIKLTDKPQRVKYREGLYKHAHVYNYAAKIPCLKCRKEFASWDKRKNRLCQRCKNSVDF